jgi:hypothetical protein
MRLCTWLYWRRDSTCRGPATGMNADTMPNRTTLAIRSGALTPLR